MTRADPFVDFSYFATLVAPVAALVSFRLARGRRHTVHRAVQVALVATYGLWTGLAIASWRRFGAALPGGFSKRHRLLGWSVFGGLCFTAASATGMYALAFVVE